MKMPQAIRAGAAGTRHRAGPPAEALAEPPLADSARDFLPPRLTLPSLRRAAAGCQGCSLYRHATQTVFGEGQRSARIMLVGEQPGNDEDLQGRPFVGPAGRVLDEALEAAGIAREDAYVTNVVKHFKWLLRGKRRLHQRPWTREIQACLPWLQKELELVQPKVLVCLGATAAQALLGKDFKVSLRHGQPVASTLAPHAMATAHPSSILRKPTAADRERAMALFVSDLKNVAPLLR
jgi:DNA polymerase